MATLRIHKKCDGRGCSHEADVYALDPYPDGWGGWYCDDCAPSGWLVVDIIDHDQD